ncbi:MULTISPECIES: hypothetical protein [Lysinibacillus]|uniref:hypothetical protein n=1 Tax=Lysinibacillus TaxID=400634 RepID=UPI00031250A0|nr:hypothetical protein [Lysinibacillus boronitolerans]
MNEQLSFRDELRKQELERPWFLQASSAPVVQFEGSKSERNLPKGSLILLMAADQVNLIPMFGPEVKVHL